MWLQPAEFSAVHEAYFEALGRALGLAQNFEQSCKFVFGIWDLGKTHEEGKIQTRDERRAYSEKLMGRMLGALVKSLRDDIDITDADKAAFEAAREARNYLAHEAAAVGLFIPPKYAWRKLREIMRGSLDMAAIEKERTGMLLAHIRDGLPKFVKAVQAIATADNIVSGWSYMIQEKEDHLPFVTEHYVQSIVAWVLEPLRIAGVIQGTRP